MDGAFEQIFEARLPCIITRLRVASLNPRRGSNGKRGRHEIIGSGMNGQCFSLELLAHDEWKLLCFIQSLAKTSQDVCPFTYEDDQRKTIEPATGEHATHIDGDILARMFISGNKKPARILQESAEGTREKPYSSATDNKHKLQGLVKAALPASQENDCYDRAIRFMRSILQIDT